MSKNKKNILPHYEMLYIVSNEHTEDEAKKITENVVSMIEKHNGKETYSEVWGKKKFTYPINHFHHGYYFLSEFDLDGGDINKLDREFELSNEVLRHMIVKKKVRTIQEIEAEKRAEEKRIREKIKESEEKEIEEEKEIKKEKKEEKKPVDLKDLDAKLDKILDTDDLL